MLAGSQGLFCAFEEPTVWSNHFFWHQWHNEAFKRPEGNKSEGNFDKGDVSEHGHNQYSLVLTPF